MSKVSGNITQATRTNVWERRERTKGVAKREDEEKRDFSFFSNSPLVFTTKNEGKLKKKDKRRGSFFLPERIGVGKREGEKRNKGGK